MDAKPLLAAVTAGTAVPVIVGWLWLTEFFMLRADAVAAHTELLTSFTTALDAQSAAQERMKVTWELDQTNSEMAAIEKGGIDATEARDYSRLEFQLEFLTKKSLELGQ